jgi:phosphate transport system substrate-binding protein
MSYCINPYCLQRQRHDNEEYCQACGTKLLINDCYRLVKPLRPLKYRHHTEVFIVEDTRDGGTPKVIKILQADEESQKLLDLFEQEAKILINLNHAGIPKAEPDGYFQFPLSDSQRLRCLLMEKIEGENLEDWVKQNGVVSQAQAIDWLRQITEILKFVHQNKLFHRDIKPSNIMLRPNGQLVLIDFGTARQLTETVIEGRTITIIYSDGYTAQEQMEGRAVPQSDFFALGRTLVYLVTGIHSRQLARNCDGELIWREQATQISKELADLIDKLIVENKNDRLQNAEQILRCLEEIENQVNQNPKKKWFVPAGFILGGVVIALFASVTPGEVLCFKDVSNVPNGIFNYGGSTTWAPIRKQVDPIIDKALPDFRLRYQNSSNGESGSTKGIEMLLNGKLDIVQSSRKFEPVENQRAISQGFELKQQAVALDGVAVAVNHSLKIPGLTVAQLKDIYTGKIRNWKEVGGADLAIKPLAHPSTGWFQENLLGAERFGENVNIIESTTQGLNQVAQEPGSIYYASASLIVNQCSIRPLPISGEPGKFIPPYKEPFIPQNVCSEKKKNQINKEVFRNEQYPLTRNLFVVYKDYPDDSILEQAGTAYTKLLLTEQGQRLIEKAGFVPIRMSNRACPSP